MAVTTTFNLDLVQSTDLTQGPTSSLADATSLANGGFAVIGSHLARTDVFDADGNGAGARVQFADLAGGLAMLATEFTVV